MKALVAVLAAVIAIPNFYLGLLGVLSCLPNRQRSGITKRTRNFCVVVPAHNEAPRIHHLLESLARQTYQADKFSVIVVADNCTDNTAELARQRGATVVERRDTAHVGKGYALEFGLARIPRDADAVFLVDADCTVSPNALYDLNMLLDQGASAIQCRYLMERVQPRSNQPQSSASDLMRHLALVLVHVVRPLAKERIGASAGLKGSGMCFERSLIDRLGWRTHGLAEDVEFHILLVQAGHRVRYAKDVLVSGIAPAILADASTQHERWEAGRLSALRTAPRLFVDGIRQRSIVRLDTALELSVPPLSVLAAALGVSTALSAARVSGISSRITAASLVSFLAYVVAGLVHANFSPKDILKLTTALPGYVLWKLRVYTRVLTNRPDTWQSTKRD